MDEQMVLKALWREMRIWFGSEIADCYTGDFIQNAA